MDQNEFLNKRATWFFIGGIGIFLIFLYYRYIWGDFNTFVMSVDHVGQPNPFLGDFRKFFYPMGLRVIFEWTPLRGYFYPTFFALLINPLSRMPLDHALFIWASIQLMLMILVLLVPALWLFRDDLKFGVLYSLIAVSSFPFLHNFRWGQVSVWLTVLVLLSFLAHLKRKPFWAGLFLALAIVTKYYPLLFLLLFLFSKDWKSAGWTIGFVGLFYLAIPIAILGLDHWASMESHILKSLFTIGPLSSVSSQYIANVGHRWFIELFGRESNKVRTALTLVGYLISSIVVGMAWLFSKNERKQSDALPLVALFLFVPFLVNTSWPHYLVYLPFCQVNIFKVFSSAGFEKALAGLSGKVLVIISTLLSSVFVFNSFADWRHYQSYGSLFFSNSLLLVCLVIYMVKLDYLESLRLFLTKFKGETGVAQV